METSVLMQLSLEFQALSGADGLAVLTLAILVRTLPANQQKKALMYGIFGAFFFRVVALVFAAHLMSFVVFKIIGGGYLVYLAMKHMFFFYKEDAHQSRPKVAANFFIRSLGKLPKLEDLAYQLIFFVGTKLLLEGLHIGISHSAFWMMMMAVIVILGPTLVYRDYYQTKTESRFHNRLLNRLKTHEITVHEVLALEYVPREIIHI